MIFNRHSHLEGLHAFLSPSNYHWMNYDDEKMIRVYKSTQAAARGVEEHDVANRLIKLGIKQAGNGSTFSMYVNDAIGYRMNTEQVLYYSPIAFGCADAICFRRNKLRVFDLKTGKTRTSEKQLFGYMALFCLEYAYKPHEIEMEGRIYQNNEKQIWIPDPDEIVHIMDRIITADRIINEMKEAAR